MENLNSKNLNLWPSFESLFLDYYIPNFWSIDDISLSYGHVMVIDPKDMPSMLWRADLEKASNYDSILHDMREIELKHNIPVGFCMSSSWKGDVPEFKKFIERNGFQKKQVFHWLTKDISSIKTDDFSSGFDIEQTKDVETVASIMRIGFSDFVADIFLKGALKNINENARQYYIAKNPKTGEVVGCSAVYYRDQYAYMSCLAVKPEFRLKSIAKDLVKARIRFLQEHGAKYIVTAVNESNQGSLEVQRKSGYVPCDVTEYWMQ